MRRLVMALMVCGVGAACGGTPTGPNTTVDDLPPVPPVVRTPLVPAGPQTFVGAGDIAQCDANSEATARLLDTIGGTVFTLGDHAYFHGTRQEFRDCYGPTWGRHRARTRPVPGNHDYESESAQPYFDYFGANAGPAGLGYYSFDLGDWHAVALNSNIDAGGGSAQMEWLRRDLAASDARCTIAYWHHPVFSSGPSGGIARMREAWRLLQSEGAEIVLSGHDHFYERYAAQDADGLPDRARGIRQFVVGTGGALPYPFAAARAGSEARVSAFGVLRLTLRTDGYDWEFLSVAGPRDAGSDLCH